MRSKCFISALLKSCMLIRPFDSNHKANHFAEAWRISKQKSTGRTVPAVGEHPQRDSSGSSDTALFLATVQYKEKDHNASSFLGLISCIGPKENLRHSKLITAEKVICIHEMEDGQKPACSWTLELPTSVGLTKYGGLPPQVLEKFRLNIDAKGKVRISLSMWLTCWQFSPETANGFTW